ncbi:DUF2225 domain-containing protein [Paenibacillus thermotolerans]|uniref:DUF2225 domain-containing protein n=1 Tax=Paenibacillus thermotolerans TaxID=3027807 RepID=UPI0023683976|nr:MULTISPECIES: DUF2225 domain-containing protein [unclassified Paenibacillus]
MEPLYQINVDCAQCGKVFSTSKVRPSFKKSIRTDSDFCMHFKPGSVNPEYYVVRVCPFCGFASTENFSQKLTERQREHFRQKIGSGWAYRDYGKTRTADDAKFTYKLALVCSQIAGERERVVAGILHHIAWLYREEGNKQSEDKFLRFALEAYIKVYETEGLELNNARLMFLIGELHRRLKDYADAIKWFGRVINDKRIMDAGMIRACREGWAQTREDMLREQLELPEELKSAGS